MSGIYLGRLGGRYHNSIVMDGARIRVINKLCSRELVARTLLVGRKKIQQYTTTTKSIKMQKVSEKVSKLVAKTRERSPMPVAL